MANATILVSTWSDGVFALDGAARSHELAGQAVQALASDGRGGALAIVEAGLLRRRTPDGTWSTLAAAPHLACCVAAGAAIYVGTNDAQLLRLAAHGALEPLPGFASVPGRAQWYAGQALVDGRMLGPPLGIRSMTATADGAVLLANVHVGGIPRSVDGGATWRATIEIDSDVHEVRAHPERSEIVAAAAAVGLCVSRDGGATWAVEHEGLHGTHCTAVAFAGDAIWISAATDHFAEKGAVYRRPIEGGPLVAVGGGFPEWLDGIADTGCIAANGAAIAVADGGGSVYVSTSAGDHWARWASALPSPSCVLVV